MDRREFLATTGTGAALLSLTSSAAAQTRPPLTPGRQILDITDFGIAAGDGDALAVANSAAVDKLLAWLLDNVPTPGLLGTAAVKVTAPSGHFRFARPWVVKCALWLEGQSNSLQYGYATHFDFDEGGFELHGAITGHEGVLARPTTGASGFRIENLYCTSRAATGTGHHGFHAVTRGEFVRCTAALFPGDGFRIESQTGFGAKTNNANSSRILYCQAGGNGGNGIHLLNGDANCVVTDGCSFSYNGGYGIFDNAFLSNHHRGHHTEGNGLGLVFPGHKIGAVSAACYYPIPDWTSGASLAPSTEGTYRTNAGKLYRLLRAGGGATSRAPTHSTTAGRGPATEGDGYQWSYEGTTLTRRYHVALGQTAAASTTAPGTDSAIWVPFEWAGATKGIPLWSRGMTWKEGGSYCGATMAGETVWEACYEELGQPHAQIRSPALWIGGQSDPSPWSTCVQIKADQGVLSNPRGFMASRPYHDGSRLRALFGSNLSTGAVMLVGHETLHPNSFVMGAGRDTYFLLDGQPANFLTFTGPLTGFTGGRSTAQPGVVNIPRLFVGSGASARAIDYGSGPPAAGHHAAGELVYNIAPAAGGKVGWVCTAAGTPGTWKAFGAIDS
ncbi:MAG: right-handed parallel beta-helix repeat-containing protein [Allosphingosinicella sp.]